MTPFPPGAESRTFSWVSSPQRPYTPLPPLENVEGAARLDLATSAAAAPAVHQSPAHGDANYRRHRLPQAPRKTEVGENRARNLASPDHVKRGVEAGAGIVARPDSIERCHTYTMGTAQSPGRTRPWACSMAVGPVVVQGGGVGGRCPV